VAKKKRATENQNTESQNRYNSTEVLSIQEMPSLESLTKDLKQAFEAKDYDKVEELITPIKVLLIQNDLLLPNFTKLSQDANYLNDLIISRSILEIGALSFINSAKFDKFQQIIDSLKTFYFNEESKELAKSTKKNKLLSLYLLLLLSNGDFVRFYTELENYTFKLANIENDLFLKYPITLANWLLEGYYDKVLKVLSAPSSSNELSESKSKLKEFQIFDEILISITREEIAKTLNKSYKTLDLKNAKNLLHLKDNDNEKLDEFVDEFNWKLEKNELKFDDNEENDDYEIENENLTITEKLVKHSLNYAKEIDSII
jgi:26S proteasome regulatory subunit N12